MVTPKFALSLYASVIAFSLLTGCSSSDYRDRVKSGRMKHDFLYWSGLRDYSKLEAAANAFLEGTNECLLDVRDRGLQYEKSANCAALKPLADAYLEAGGDAPEGQEPSIIYAEGQMALKYTWTARSVSALGGGMQSVWVW